MSTEDIKEKLYDIVMNYMSKVDDELSRIQFLCKSYSPDEIAIEIEELRRRIY